MTTEVSEDEEQAQPASHEIRHVAFAAPNGDDLPISVPYQDDEADAHDPFAATKDSCYARYHVTVDRYAGDRGTEIQLCSTRRPHMRAFHCAWVSFFLAFFVWFAPAPLQREIQKTLHLTEQQLWTSNITNDVMAIVLRSLIGPLCDSYGPRIPMSIVLMVASIPCACVGLIQTAAGLAGIRFCIGIAGSSFVMAQFWPSTMFAQEIVGTANGMVAGWGNFGGAVAQGLIGTILFPAFRTYYGSSERAWRVVCVIPAALAFTCGAILPFVSDDAPMGNFAEMKRRGTADRVLFTTSMRSAAVMNTWILYVQYACCFGVELVMTNASVLYFTHEFGMNTEQAATFGFIYGSMNLFARGLGGFCSDKINLIFGLRGRLYLTTILLVCQGTFVLIFPFASTLSGAVVTMCIFSVFTKAAEGSIFGTVPYVRKLYTGAVSGLVGAGGNVGSVIFGLGFRYMAYREGFILMGAFVIASSLLSIFIKIPCHASMLWGKDNHSVIQARERYLRRRQLERQAYADGSQRRPDGRFPESNEETSEGVELAAAGSTAGESSVVFADNNGVHDDRTQKVEDQDSEAKAILA